jgi:hypothetical protein
MLRNPGPWQCVLFLIPRSFHDGGALNYSTAPHRSKTTLISNGVFCLLESKILSIGQTLLFLYSLGETNAMIFSLITRIFQHFFQNLDAKYLVDVLHPFRDGCLIF